MCSQCSIMNFFAVKFTISALTRQVGRAVGLALSPVGWTYLTVKVDLNYRADGLFRPKYQIYFGKKYKKKTYEVK